ncbi:hypothetical protein SLUN_00105 [Streptomyces lunaelactis]|uniref:Uncharacterized protein n=1 Tax=Streptomyces lunaelactis TaxID=1535768 RepID=A0A2R4SVK4_9ACTN|nr:hypothetical protein [Streptomyces lunaelactis]AVZ70907.1 hypothetical protein SLUN_00105 [Streptomyces lunaelactis]NUK25163.1 hypothetical protein [Streptomyces lunaelactis]NUK85626.1 hypothetical protein [Streptomyces lunaelactis]
MPQPVDFYPLIVTTYPDDAEHATLLLDPAAARIVTAGDVVEGDVILASFPDGSADYFNDQYEAHPQPFDPTCQCGVCCLQADCPGPAVVLSKGHPWHACDPWAARELVLIVPASQLP